MTAAIDFTPSTELRADLRAWRTRALIIGIIGAILCAVGFFQSPTQFYRSYLWPYLFVVGMAAGSLAWLMLQYLTGGSWGVVIRRPCEAAVRTFPLVILMFLPILIGMPNLYDWTHPNLVAADEVLRHKSIFLNTRFFLIRSGIYLFGWFFLGRYMNRWSAREDAEGGTIPNSKMGRLAGPGLVFWGFAVTFVSIDWVMSLSPHWQFSTMYGLLFIAGFALGSLALQITVLVFLSRRAPMAGVLTPRHMHDLGKLMLALVMVWTYFSFSQFLIIWAGNLPKEISWYMERLNYGWEYVALALIVGHFALPFGLLLSRDLKRNFKLLASIAVFVLLMRFVDLYWFVIPDATKAGFHPSWMDLATPLGLVGLWLAYFFHQLEQRPLMPLHDPQLEEALEHGR
ncbi:MAG TPA: hypothetical protein VMU19_03145 [Bryobacteraceae bacterium]|nr:hypothetical protein [Bryobacteraceae bacterium]